MKKVIIANTFVFLISIIVFSCSNATSENTAPTNSTTVVAEEESTTVEEIAPTATEEESIPVAEEIIEQAPTVEKTNTTTKEPKKEPKAEKKAEKPIVEQVVEKIEPVVEQKIEIVKPNHQSWDELTNKYVTSSGKVNYKGIKTEMDKLKLYLEHLASTPTKPEWTKNETLAYWFNLYNASTVYLIVQQYPIKSITDLEGGKPWDKKFIKSGDKVYSLNDIENVIVRPNFNEPLVHVAFNCAAKSCPSLLKGAFLPEKLNAQLTVQAKAWLNDASKNKISSDKVEVSQIFNWYKADFDNVGGVLGFINKYSTNKANANTTISFLEYNWELNE